MKDPELLFYIILAWFVCAGVLICGAYRDYQRIMEERKRNSEMMKGDIEDEFH